MSVNLSTEELGSLKELYNLNNIKFTDARYNNTVARENIINNISRLLIAASLDKSLYVPKEADEVQRIIDNKTDSKAVVFGESVAIALLMGYLQSLNNDRAIEETPEFGYKGLDEAFQTAVLTYMNEFSNPANADRLLECGLGIKIRECSEAEYFKNEYYHQDIATLSKILTADIDDGYNKKMKETLGSIDDIVTSMDSYMEDLKATYTLLLEDGFGIQPYVGVLSDTDGFLTIADDSNEATIIKKGELTLKKLSNRLYSRISDSVRVSDSRQFDYADIFKSDVPVYFPWKMVEYVMGRESTLNLNKNIYKSSVYSVSWESYSENYVYPNLREVLLRGVYKAFEKVLLDSNKIEVEFVSPEFVLTDYKEFVLDYLSDTDIYNSVFKYVSKIVASLKCCYILTKYPYLANKIAAINLRVTCESKSKSFSTDTKVARELFGDLIASNNKEEFFPPIDLTRGRASATNVAISINIFEYQYDINPMLSHAEPLFGYTIQKQNQKRGRTSNWDNILIGEEVSGKELYASKTSDIKLQNNFIHNIIAGSRSGKGVMTMNILASALVSGKPVFYLDRKPDMASMMYELSGGTQFIVNGGLVNSEFDIYNHFDESTGDAMTPWKKTVSYLNANPKILELFDVSNTGYQSVLGDYIYFRAFMFCMGICVLRTKLAGKNDKLRNEVFNGNDGVVIVIDELTGFQTSMGRLFSTISSTLVQKALVMDDVDKILDKKADLEAKIRVAQTKITESDKESVKIQQEAEIRKLQHQIDGLIDVQSLYAGTLFAKIRDSFVTLQSQKVAGFKNKEFSYSDIFVLGQFLDANYYASSLTSKTKGSLSPVFFPLTSTKEDYYAAYKGADIIRSFLEELGQSDWFLGRNPDYNYGGKSENPDAKRVTDIDGNWDYVGTHSCNEIRGIDSASFNHVLFKPYLVLNTHLENDPPTVLSSDLRYQYVTQCANRVNETAGGIDLWETVRLKHIRSDVKPDVTKDNPRYDCLEEGVGFKGLVQETLLTTSGDNISDIDDYIKRILGKSGDIANYVAKEMGYTSWQELIFDLSPEGLFSFDDIVNAVINKPLYTKESRLPLYAKLGTLENNEPTSSSQRESFDDRFGNIFEEANNTVETLTSNIQEEDIQSSRDGVSQNISNERIPDDVLLSFCEQFAEDKVNLYKYKYPNKPLSSKHKSIIKQTYFEEFRSMGY